MRNCTWAGIAGVLLIVGACSPSQPKPAETSSSRDEKPAAESAIAANTAKDPASDPAEQATPAVANLPATEPAGAIQTTAAVAPTAPISSEPAALPANDPAIIPLDEPAVADLVMPKMTLSEAHAKTCRVQVGDSFPTFELSDLAGEKQEFARLLGKQLTVVVFWRAGSPMSLEEVADVERMILRRFGRQGVAAVGVNVGDERQLAAELAKQAGVSYPQLSDQDRQAFDQVATAHLPRTYLLDGAGKIVWFDLEYSRTTRRDLAAAVRYRLAHATETAGE